MSGSAQHIAIDGRRLSLTNLGKVLYPATGTTKVEVIDYYTQIAPVLLPHLRDHPITLKRYPNGVGEAHFYEKQCPSHRPEWIRRCRVESDARKGESVDYCVIDDLPALVWAANLAAIELHPLLFTCEAHATPTMLVFDLDPGPGVALFDCIVMAKELRALLKWLGLSCFPKTSGGKGIHVYVPLNTELEFHSTKSFAHAVALLMQQQHPKKVTSLMRKELREGKIFIDWSQNDNHKTTVAPYSLRAGERPTVSTPLLWEELDEVRNRRDTARLVFSPEDVVKRVDAVGDLFAPMSYMWQRLPEI